MQQQDEKRIGPQRARIGDGRARTQSGKEGIADVENSTALAVIREVGYGLHDGDRPCLWFLTYTGDGAALQMLLGEAAQQVLVEAGITDAHELEGRLCWVEQGGLLNRFKCLCPPGGGHLPEESKAPAHPMPIR